MIRRIEPDEYNEPLPLELQALEEVLKENYIHNLLPESLQKILVSKDSEEATLPGSLLNALVAVRRSLEGYKTNKSKIKETTPIATRLLATELAKLDNLDSPSHLNMQFAREIVIKIQDKLGISPSL